jgi:hypothetical protein
MSKIMMLILFLIVCIPNSLCDPSPTEWTDPKTGTYYNFGALKRDTNNPWKVKDGADNGLFSMVYFFNFGGPHNQKCKK